MGSGGGGNCPGELGAGGTWEAGVQKARRRNPKVAETGEIAKSFATLRITRNRTKTRDLLSKGAGTDTANEKREFMRSDILARPLPQRMHWLQLCVYFFFFFSTGE